MQNSFFRRMRAPLACLFLLLILGCGTTRSAKLLTWRPAQYDVMGVERLAVLGFRAPPRVAAVVEGVAWNDLSTSRFYRVASPRQQVRLQASHIPLPTEPGGLDQIVGQGRRLGVDAVLVGKVSRRLDLGAELGALTVRTGDPQVDINIKYYVVDVRNKRIRAQQNITRTGTAQGLGEDARLTEQMVDELVRTCAAEMVKQILPGSELVEVELARVNLGKGSGYLRDGNQQAAAGNWREAAKLYRATLEVNPHCHQAIYNMGLTAEAQGHFREARTMYQRAARESDEPLYRQALSRLDQTQRNYHIAQQQLHRPLRR